jgi:CubicO group peptidase (beta-lactamase class C family)
VVGWWAAIVDAFCRKRIFAPLGMKHTAFNPPKEWAADCAATERPADRKEMLRGIVHDENARAAGGVTGHAGLFSTASDLATFCRALLKGKVLKESTLAEMTQLGQVPVYPWQGLGWELDCWSSSSMGYLPSRATFGHTGWTGLDMGRPRRQPVRHFVGKHLSSQREP